ncbi:tRNA-dependent cyclodipeptide synthase [Streptomyces rugosispiralis]|uniref:Cyclodipeptide synthase n=1 Tax=Streptomyces rugosispiralis TaxID=2967341 RepID=A0ABT1UPL6_9ACTN|nr:tRNA-dependent cyclodipeptide synthase [Streptomyces rugosispiralis]MCQ8186921.1 tRNA-dependent cyclodipeptide synthase [Streptomyces rugosispiralis]
MVLDTQAISSPRRQVEPARRTRYKAEIASVSPATSRTTFEQHDTCFLGVSLENSNFTTAKLAGMVKWISRRFARCTVLIGDSIHRLTLESTCGMAPEEALEQALELGRQFVESERKVFDEYGTSTDFTFLNCSDVQRCREFAEFHDELRTFFTKDEMFRSSVESFGRAYHRKHSHGISGAEWENRIRTSSEYFLEEFSIFACLKRQGLPVMVYPGSFSTLSEIARGEHPGAPEELRDLVVVSLHLKGR